MSDLIESSISEVPVVVLDTETTGLFPGVGHRVVELAAIRMETSSSRVWRVTDQFSQLINPGRSMDPDASRINGILDEDLLGKPSFEDISEEIFALTEGALLVAHNAQFDASFLGMELHIMNIYKPRRDYYGIPNPWLCTLMVARRNFHFGNNSLGHIARMLGVRTGRAHRALGDVFTTAEVLKRMIDELARRGIVLVGDLLHAQGGPIYTPVVPKIELPHPIDKALVGGRQLRIQYDGPGGMMVHNVNPQYATEYNGRQYLITYCDSRRDQRTFRVDKILKAEILEGGESLLSGKYVDDREAQD
ncbi:MAG: exonuclease domain-containing protein [Candidatus Promineifilaceae bacterium]